MFKNKISVIMTVYKESEKELRESLESIINQTYKNLEIIVVIDYPDEKWREEFIKKYRDDRIKLFVNEKNIGLPLSLNKALEHVTGDYIARMDADDISHIDRLEKQFNYLKKYEYDLVGSYMQYFYEDDKLQLAKYPLKPESINKLLKYKSCILHPTWLAKPDVFKKNNGYRNIFSCEDYDFLIRASLNGFKLANYPEILYDCRLSENSISRSNSGKQELISLFLKKYYRKNKVANIDDLQKYIESDKFKKDEIKFNKYCMLKNKRARMRKSNNKLSYLLYTLLIVINFKHSYNDIQKNMIEKFLIFKEKRISDEK